MPLSYLSQICQQNHLPTEFITSLEQLINQSNCIKNEHHICNPCSKSVHVILEILLYSGTTI